MKRTLKKATATLAVFLIFTFSVQSVFAEVYTEKTGGGKADTLYIAGNPNLYPIEYFDQSTKTYKGVIPEMLKEISQKTGIGFTYISADGKDNRKSLYKNSQIEIVSAVTSAESDFRDMEKAVVLSTKSGENGLDYYLAFTEVLHPELKATITSAIAEISDSQKNAWLIDCAKTDLAKSNRQMLLAVIIGAVLLFSVIITVVLRHKAKKKRETLAIRMTDTVTGVGDGDYYLYAFENLITEQSKNLYCSAYIAFNGTLIEERQKILGIADIEKYIATKLTKLITDREYLSKIAQGTFLLLFQAESESVAESRVAEITATVNDYLANYTNGEKSLVKTGYCRFCDDIGIDAETAVYNAKQGYLYALNNSLSYHIGTKAQIEINKKQNTLLAQVYTALQNGEFKIYLQFLVDAKTDKICGAEVLSRWHNSEYGLLHPNEYIDILSESGKVIEHDYKIFEQLCAALQKWSDPPFNNLFLSCNFTRLSISNKGFAKKLAVIAKKYNFAHNRLLIEITENSLTTNREIVSENIKQLSMFGFKVAIDDMGTGFSSLADIYDNEIDIVKIEREFVSSCVTERRKQMLCNIIFMVHNAGAKVICEGIENAEQQEMLKSIDCDILQGYYNSRVLPFAESEKFYISSLKQ